MAPYIQLHMVLESIPSTRLKYVEIQGMNKKIDPFPDKFTPFSHAVLEFLTDLVKSKLFCFRWEYTVAGLPGF